MVHTSPAIPHNVNLLLTRIKQDIQALPWVDKIYLFGSFATCTYHENSDLDIAVFVRKSHACQLDQYRQLARLCRTKEFDIQVQMFFTEELLDPCGIVEEIVEHGVDITEQFV